MTNAEVMQEILQRYTTIRRPDAIQPAMDALMGVVDEVFPIEAADARSAKEILWGQPALSARDALHISVMKRRVVERVMGFDAGFDGVGWLVGEY